MSRFSLALVVLTLGIMTWSSCNDPSPIGAELLEQDQANVVFTDTFTLATSTISEDSILVYDPDPSVTYRNYLFGDFADPIFGKTTASIYSQVVLSFDPPDFSDATSLDSIVLSLDYDSLGTYGNLSEPYGIGIYRVTEDMDIEERYYSNQTFNFDSSNPLAELSSFAPRVSTLDSVDVISYVRPTDIDTVRVEPHLRIRLDDAFGQELLDLDSSSYASNTNFIEHFKGIYVKPLNETAGILGFNLNNAVSRLTVYYSEDTLQKEYSFRFSSSFVRITNLVSDVGGSVLADYIDDDTKGGELLFTQSMIGPNIRCEFPYADQLDNVIINKAELEFTVAVLEDDNEALYTPINQLIISREDETAGQVFIRDVIIGGLNFGGTPRLQSSGGVTVHRYNMNISSHFQEIVDGTLENVIFIRPFPKQESAKRVVLYGPKDSVDPVKLKLTYTKLNQ